MTYITKDTPITELPMSGRALNCLRRSNIHIVGAMIDCSIDELASIRNIGSKTIEEIQNWIQMLKSGIGDYILDGYSTEYQNVPNDVESSSSDSENTEGLTPNRKRTFFLEKDIPIRELPIPIRAKNGLIKSGYEYVSQLVGITYEMLMEIPYMGVKTAEEVTKYLDSISTYDKEVHDESSTPYDNQLALEMIEAYGETSSFWLPIILDVKGQYPEAIGESLIYRIYDNPTVREHIREKILIFLESNKGISTKIAMCEQLPTHLSNTTIVEEILLELENSFDVEIGDVLVTRLYPSVIEFIEQIKDARVREVIKGRVDGKTFVEIGEQYGVTKERAHQIMQKGLRKKPILREDKYLYIYENYDFSEEDFLISFDETRETYYYLEMICPVSRSKKKLLEDILTDTSIPAEWRKKVERVIYKQYVSIDGGYVKKTRPELVKFMVKRYCKSLTKMDDFAELYQAKLDELGLGDDPLLVIDTATCANAIMLSNYALWNQWNSFRYYNIPEYDCDDFVSTVGLEKFENTELSTLKIFRDYPELMRQYDIRDEYELHNFLRKTWPQEICKIKFLRMPTIEIGNANRDEQILSLLLQYAPISAAELAEKYEELYGVRATTVRGGYLKPFNNYFYNGMYSVNYASLPTTQFNRMKTVLNQDYYTIQEAKRLYKREFPESNATMINPYTLKTLGFHVYPGYSGYIIKNTYSSATDFFNSILTRSQLVDMRDYDVSIKYLATYGSELRKLRGSYEIVEFSPLQYINISRLNELDITKEHLVGYCKAVAKFYEKGDYFTTTSMYKDGFTHPLDDLGFEDWFYSSLLFEDRDRFAAQRIGGTRIFLRGKTNCNLSGMIIWLLEQYQKIDIYDLIDLLQNHYGINMPKEKIIEIINDTDLYYDAIMEAVYIDYDTYFEEI